MGSVIQLVKRSLAATPKSAVGPHYFCTRCQGETFRVFESGAIRCERCGSKMRNLQVVSEKEPA